MEDPVITELKKSKAFRKGSGGPDRKVPHYYKYIMDHVIVDGLWLDFCIGNTNATTGHIISNSPDDVIIYGFDWFQGLPEDWIEGDNKTYKKGEFRAVNNPEAVIGFAKSLEERFKKLRAVVGLIQDTLPLFVVEYDDVCAFVHVDCDLYCTSDVILSTLRDRIVSGTIIAFDEFWGYDNYLDGEYKAFMEFIDVTGHEYEFIAHVANKRQAAIKIL